MNTIKDTVLEFAELLRSYKTHSELKEWANMMGYNNATAFSNFKKALLEIGINYDEIRQNTINESIQKKIEQESEFIKSQPEPTQNLFSIAEKINGKVWLKDNKRRIYVDIGNNYHYNGKWWIDFLSDGSYTAKVWLNSGYNNKNSQEYINKYLRIMENMVKEAMQELNLTEKNLSLV